MLRITIYAVGKLKERFWKEACAEYLKRLGAYAKVNVVEIPDSNIEAESAALLGKLPEKSPVILLDRTGTQLSSEELSELIDAYALGGDSDIAFVIGGSDGVNAQVQSAATRRVSFGRITLPHNLARVVLLEQLYRAFKISRGEPYHK